MIKYLFIFTHNDQLMNKTFTGDSPYPFLETLKAEYGECDDICCYQITTINLEPEDN